MTRAGGSGAWESWDGKTLYYSRGSNVSRQVLALPLDGGPERVVLENVFGWNYVPAPDGLYFIGRSAANEQFKFEIRFRNTITGETRVVTNFEARGVFPALTVSPDGKTIVHSAVPLTASADLMLLEHFR